MTAGDIEKQLEETMGHPARNFSMRLVSRPNWDAFNRDMPAGLHRGQVQLPEERLEHFNNTFHEVAQVFIIILMNNIYFLLL